MVSHRRKQQKGNVFVETSLVLTSFLLVMVGIVDLAQILYVNQALAERVRGVARASAINGASPEEIRNLIAYGNKEGPARERDDGQSGQPVTDGEQGLTEKGFMGLLPEYINVQVLDRTFNEHRLVVEISGLPVTIVSPLIAGRGQNLPLRITVPLEEP